MSEKKNTAKGASKKVTGKTEVVKKGDDLDDILAEFGVEVKAKKADVKNEDKKAAEPSPAISASPEVDDTDASGEQETKQLSKAQLKRQKQKEKDKAKAAAVAAGTAPPPEEKKDVKDKDGDKKKKGVAALKAKLDAQKAEDDRRKKEDEERKRAEEEESKRLEAEAKKAEEDRLNRIEARKLKREQLRKEGKLLTKTEKERLARAEAAKAIWKEKGIEVPSEGGEKKKVSYGKKKNKNKNKGKEDGDAATEENDDETPLEPEQADTPAPMEEEEEDEKDIDDSPLIAEEKALLEEDEDEVVYLEGKEIESIESGVAAEEGAAVADSWDADENDFEAAEKRKVEKIEQRKKAALEEKRQKHRTDKKERLAAIKQQKEENVKRRQEILAKKAAKAAEIAAASATANSKSNEDESEDSEEEDDDDTDPKSSSKDESFDPSGRRKKKDKRELRSPIIAVLGHVDVGKTKILDRIRSTNVQEGEMGGITQQIGATFVPKENIEEQTRALLADNPDVEMRVPGLLIIDTPGHESFTNLRTRGSGLCDIAILVVDLMHGLEPQTIESINLLKQRKTPFIIALNKVDRLYGWQSSANAPIQKSLGEQGSSVVQEFRKRTQDAILQMAEQGLNCALYYENPDVRKYVSVVPTSAHTGEGVPYLLFLLVKLTQSLMTERLSYGQHLQCTVLEVKQIEGLGTTVDVILVNGILKEGDTIVLAGMEGPITTQIRSLLTPPPMREIRVKSEYVHHKEVRAAMGLKIAAPGLDSAVAGSQLLVWDRKGDLEELKDEVQSDLQSVLSKVDKSGEGVYVIASTLGSLEALLTFLQTSKIPVAAMNIGTVFKADVMKASVMLEKKRPEYSTILAFDVKVAPDAKDLAEKQGVRIFTAGIIYHLFDMVCKYMEDIKAQRKQESASVAVFPTVLSIIKVFNAKNPLVIGVRVVEGVVRVGTPLVIEEVRDDRKDNNRRYLGRITGIEKNHTPQTEGKKDEELAIKVEMDRAEHQSIYLRHFDDKNRLVSKLTRESIDQLKAHFQSEMTQDDWKVVIKLKKYFEIM